MSSEREGRILIVDDQRDIARVLRTSLELLNRGYFIVDVPSGEEAMLEIQGKEFDVLVTDHRLPGMRGTELIERARKRTPGIKAIMITGSPLDEVKSELGRTELHGIFQKPIDTSAFADSVTRALLGEQAAALPTTKQDQLGPIPSFPDGPITRRMAALIRDLGASAVVFVDRTGRVLLTEGMLDQSLRFSELAVLLAHNFTTTVEIASYLGDEPPSALHYYDGNWHDIYALSVGTHFFLAIVFPGGSQKQMGVVLRFGKPAVEEIIDAIGEEALTIPGVMEVVTEEAPAATAEVAAPQAPPEEAPRRKVKTAPLQPAIELDMDSLDAALSGEVSDAGSFWEEAASDASGLIDDTISAEEARRLGLLSKDE